MMDYYTSRDFANEQNLPLPLALVTSEKYKDVTGNEKILYALLKYRMRLSLRSNGKFEDETGCFIYFKQDELADLLQTSTRTIRGMMANLVKHGLVFTKKQGLGLPQKIYLAKIDADANNFRTERKKTSARSGTTSSAQRGSTSSAQSGTTSSGPYSRELIQRTDTGEDKKVVGKKSAQKRTQQFHPPTLDELKAYMAEKGYTFSAEAFIAYYESNGWKVGRNPMRNWKAACVTWQRKERASPSHVKEKPKVHIPDYFEIMAEKERRERENGRKSEAGVTSNSEAGYGGGAFG